MNTEVRLLMVGSYAAATKPGIHLLRWHAAASQFTPVSQFTGITNPSFLVIHPNRPWVYAVSETAKGMVWALRLAAANDTLLPLNQQPSGGDDPCHLQIDSSGRWLLVSHYSSGSVAVLPIQPDGSLGVVCAQVQHTGSSVHPQRQTAAHAHSACFTPDGRFVIVADLGLDALCVYGFDSEKGQLFPQACIGTKPGAGPRHMVFHPRGRVLYVANELDSTVTAYDYQAGQCQERQTLPTIPPDASPSYAAHLALAPSGQQLFVSNRGHNSLARFAVAGDGQLLPQGYVDCGGDWPRHFALTTDYLIVANQYSHTLTLLPANLPGSPLATIAIPAPSCVQFLLA